MVALVAVGAYVSRDGNVDTSSPKDDRTTLQDDNRAGNHAPTQPAPSNAAAPVSVDRVVVVSVDGLASYAVTSHLMPELTALLRSGAGTRNARTSEQTVTLPNHTSMVTGRPIETALNGHGVDWNVDLKDRRVRRGVASIFSHLADTGLKSAIFVGKSKFSLWVRSWPGTIRPYVVFDGTEPLVTAAIDDLENQQRALTFVHVAAPDAAGHADGWGSPSYKEAVRGADEAIGQIRDAIDGTSTVLIVTADHGGIRGTTNHADFTDPDAYTIPFIVWGPGVAHGGLYELNEDYADPGTMPPTYDPPQMVRNGAVANLVADLLGLPPVPDSSINFQQDLDVLQSSQQ